MLSWGEHLLALQAGLLVPAVEVYLRRAGFRACQRRLRQLAGSRLIRISPAEHRPQLEQVQRLALVVGFGCSRYAPYAPVCLARALVLQFLLTRRGITCRLRLGTKTSADWFVAHAWLEYRGVALNEAQPPALDYVPFEDSDKIAG